MTASEEPKERQTSPFVWVQAWEGTMQGVGFPRARLDVYLDQSVPLEDALTGPLTYSWVTDVDEFLAGALQDSDAWTVAHWAFAFCDPLRPERIVPSPMLAEILENMTSVEYIVEAFQVGIEEPFEPREAESDG